MKPAARPTTSRLTRREFLRQSVLTAGTVVVLGPNLFTQAAAPAALPVIDTHIHLYDPTRPGGIRWPTSDDAVLYSPHLPKHFRALTEKLGVVGAVVVEANAGPDDNQWVLDIVRDDSIIVGYIGRLTPGQSNFASNFDRYVENPIFRGLRLSRSMLAQGLGQKAFEKDLQRLAERQLTLDLVGGAPVLPDVLRVAKLAPDLRLVIDHLPFRNWDGDPAAMRKALQEIAQLPNVYAKISEVARRVDGHLIEDPDYYRPGLDLLWELFGVDRVLYGSNWPVSDYVAPYASVHKIVADYLRGKDLSVAEKYFWKNSLVAYHWQPRGAAAGLIAK